MMTVAVLSGLGVFSFLMLLLFCDVLTEAVAGGGALSVLLEISMPLLSCCFGLRTQASGFVLVPCCFSLGFGFCLGCADSLLFWFFALSTIVCTMAVAAGHLIDGALIL
ncbi:hypothetical protein Ancab_005055 [Ancistrocladus abbreviatus]